MAHAALVDSGIVRQVIVVDNDKLPNGGEFTPEVETALNEYLNGIGLDGDWKLTSYNNNFRGTYAGIGYTYDNGRDAFISPKPYELWVLDEASSRWAAPVKYPTDGSEYLWDEDSLSWVEVEAPIIP